MSKLVFLTICASLAALVAGHARMTSPVPWNNQERTTSPCGGGAPQGTASLQLTTGGSVTIGWNVKASDGNGPVTLRFATQTATNPTTPGGTGPALANPVLLSPSPVALGPYTLTGTLPALAPGLYTMQAASSTGWYSCTTVQILAAGQQPTPGSGGQAGGGSATPAYTQQCVNRASQLFYCGAYRGQPAQIAPGTSIDVGGNTALAQSQLTYEQQILEAVQVNLNNTRVLGTGLSQACEAAYRRFLCAHSFPLCGNPFEMPACKSACYEFADVCGLTDSHKGLYDCSAMQVTGSDSMGTCAPCTGACALTLGASSQVTYSLAVIVWLFAALLAL